jgi:branched-chain amino acid transport system permease protein
MDMSVFVQQVVTGVFTGSLYGLMALTFVLIWRSSRALNFGQGEMATFTTFIFWAFVVHVPYSIGLLLVLPIAFVMGSAIERGLIRQLEGKPPLNALLLTLGLFLIFNSLSLSVWGSTPHFFTPPLSGSPYHVLGINIPKYQLFVFICTLVATAALYALFQFTKLGLAMRATAFNKNASELCGIPTSIMLMVGWGLAAVMGAIVGVLIAPIATLTPNMSFTLLLLGFTAGVLGGLESPGGVVIGGFFLGVAQNLVGTYLDDWVNFLHLPFDITNPNAYRNVVAIVLIIVILQVKPGGVFGRAEQERA